MDPPLDSNSMQHPDLPSDVLTPILAFLPLAALLACRGVCRDWRAAADDDAVWRRYLRARYPLGGVPATCPLSSWLAYAKHRRAADVAAVHVVQSLRFRESHVPPDDPIHAQLAAWLHASADARVVAADVVDALTYTRDAMASTLSERRAAYLVLRRLRWLWNLDQLETALSSESAPVAAVERAWALVSAARLVHLDPATQVVAPLERELDALAAGFRPAAPASDVYARVVELGAYLFSGAGAGVSPPFRGNVEDFGNPANSYLHTVLATRRGLPIALCILLASVARRVSPPIEISLANFPSHFLARIDVPRAEGEPATFLLDPFSYDPARPESSWIAPLSTWVARLTHVAWHPSMTSPAPPRSVLTRVLNNLEGVYTGRIRTPPTLPGGAPPPPPPLAMHHLYRVHALLLHISPAPIANTHAGMSSFQVAWHLLNETAAVLDAPDMFAAVRRRGHSSASLRLIPMLVAGVQRDVAPLAGTYPPARSTSPVAGPEPMHNVGALVRHAAHGYTAVVVAAHAVCRAADDPAWAAAALGAGTGGGLRRGTNQPFYAVLVAGAAEYPPRPRYVAHEVLVPLGEEAGKVLGEVGWTRAVVPQTGRGWLAADLGVPPPPKREGVYDASLGEMQDEPLDVLVLRDLGRAFDRADVARARFVRDDEAGEG
ncbi:hypothetical protein H9P43_003869 [Blastocladiella emersonii ATCC 22665]|nr:hypothetical protein H9P43_003869 [Blastocladiella emersonii ATCC 22665]